MGYETLKSEYIEIPNEYGYYTITLILVSYLNPKKPDFPANQEFVYE